MNIVEKVTYTVGGEHRKLTQKEKERLRDDFAKAMGYKRVINREVNKNDKTR